MSAGKGSPSLSYPTPALTALALLTIQRLLQQQEGQTVPDLDQRARPPRHVRRNLLGLKAAIDHEPVLGESPAQAVGPIAL